MSTDIIVIEIPGVTTVITSAEQGPPGVDGTQNLYQLLDVDSTNKTEGSMLVYSSQNQKWVTTNQLENQIIDSGQY